MSPKPKNKLKLPERRKLPCSSSPKDRMYGANSPLSLSVQYFESPKRISSAFHTPESLFSVRATIRLEKIQSQLVNAEMKPHRIFMTTMMIGMMIKQCNDDDEDHDSGFSNAQSLTNELTKSWCLQECTFHSNWDFDIRGKHILQLLTSQMNDCKQK